jgi:hypothetical protein
MDDAPDTAVGMGEREPMQSTDAKYWLDKIGDYKKATEKWGKQCDNIDRQYSKANRSDSADREYSIFWANLEVLKTAVYARAPVPVVVPRFKDKNVVASGACDVLERAMTVAFDQSDVHGVMVLCRDEYLRYGRGTPWVRLANGPAGEPIIAYDHVCREDFAHDLARNWRENEWVSRRTWPTKDDGLQRFGPIFEGVGLKKRAPQDDLEDKTAKAPVWEIWDKTSRMVYWVAEGFDEILDQQPPWLDLSSFWPCPRPAYSTLNARSLIPIPDLLQYKDQIEEINEYTARIASLSETLKMRGFYPAGGGDLSDAIEMSLRSQENRALLVPVSSMAAFSGGSLRDTIVWWPVTDVLQLIQGRVELRRVVIDDVYQITGIADVMRGASEASETLGAQQIKAQWGSARIRERQGELSRVARDLTRISAEIMAENFDPETLLKMSQVQLPTMQQQQQAQMFVQQAQAAQQQPPQPGMPQQPPVSQDQLEDAQELIEQASVEAVMGLLRDDQARGFVIDVETDSTIQPDEDAEKTRRMEFVTSVGGLIQQAAPLVMQAPMFGAFMGEVLKFAAAGFRAGRPLEAAIDQLVEQLESMAKQPQQSAQPDPTEQVKLQAEQVRSQAEQIKAQASVQRAQIDLEKAKVAALTPKALPQPQEGTYS